MFRKPIRFMAFVAMMAVFAAVVLGACSGSGSGSGSDDSPTPTTASPTSVSAQLTPNSTSQPPASASQQPAATPIPAPTPATTLGPVGLDAVTVDYLSGMVLDQDSIDEELSGLALTARSGPLSGDEVATHTIDPTDTDATITDTGYVGGYENTFANPTALLTLSASSRTYLWQDEESARDFIERQMTDAERLRGAELVEGTSLVDAEELAKPSLGDDARAGVLTGYVTQLDQGLTTTYWLWRRGNIVASVALLAFDGVDRTDVVSRLAAVMDKRIDGVLAGEITAAPPPQARPPLPATGDATAEGFDVPAMVPTLDDLPADAKLQSEGPSPEAGALEAYSRRFVGAETTMQLGSSEATEVQITVGVHSSPQIAAIPIQTIASLGADELGGLFRQGFASGAGAAPTNVLAEPVPFPSVGDASTVVVMRLTTFAGELESYLVYFSRGRVRAQLSVVGQIGKVHGEDLIELAELIDDRIRSNSP